MFSENLNSIEVLPVLESPISTTLNIESKSSYEL